MRLHGFSFLEHNENREISKFSEDFSKSLCSYYQERCIFKSFPICINDAELFPRVLEYGKHDF